MDVILNLKCISLISCAELIQPRIFPAFRCRPVGSRHDDCLARQALTYLRNDVFVFSFIILCHRFVGFNVGPERRGALKFM